MTIKIRYIFVNRERERVELPDNDVVAQFIIADRRREASDRRKEQRHNYSLDAIVYAGEDFQDKTNSSPELLLIEREKENEIAGWTKKLTETQRRRLLMRLQGMSIREISEAEGVSQQRIAYTLKQISKKL